MAKKKKCCTDKTPKAKPLTYFSNEQYLSFALVKGKGTLDLGTAAAGGKVIAVYLEIENDDDAATWSIDCLTTCARYEQTRTIPNNVSTAWHHINTNTDTTTNVKLKLTTTSDHKEAKGLAKIRIY